MWVLATRAQCSLDAVPSGRRGARHRVQCRPRIGKDAASVLGCDTHDEAARVAQHARRDGDELTPEPLAVCAAIGPGEPEPGTAQAAGVETDGAIPRLAPEAPPGPTLDSTMPRACLEIRRALQDVADGAGNLPPRWRWART